MQWVRPAESRRRPCIVTSLCAYKPELLLLPPTQGIHSNVSTLLRRLHCSGPHFRRWLVLNGRSASVCEDCAAETLGRSRLIVFVFRSLRTFQCCGKFVSLKDGEIVGGRISLFCSYIHLFSFIYFHSFIHSFSQSVNKSFNRAFICHIFFCLFIEIVHLLFINLLIYSVIRLFIHPFIHLFIQSLTHSLSHLYRHSFVIYSFILSFFLLSTHSFIHSCTYINLRKHETPNMKVTVKTIYAYHTHRRIRLIIA